MAGSYAALSPAAPVNCPRGLCGQIVASATWERNCCRAAAAAGLLAALALVQALCTFPVGSSVAETKPLRANVRQGTSSLASDWEPQSQQQHAGPIGAARDPKGKSWYFILIDSFARSNGDARPCDTSKPGWCNGTIRGITEHLDYIQGMGFECIWITPVLKQFYGPDPDGESGYGEYGYWAYDWYAIDENYGTKADLVELSAALHERKMCLVYDMVVNHVGPVHSSEDVHRIVPFNETWHYNTPGIGNMTFDQYSKGIPRPPPYQAIGPGAMCDADLRSCSNYKCPVDLAFGEACLYLNNSAPGPRNLPYCGVGDYVCPGYDERRVHEGWFYSLGDLNQSVPFVRNGLIRWAKYMVSTYDIDGIRLDTAPYVPTDFLSELQQAVGIPILGEVTSTNFSFFSSYSPASGAPVLKGLLNFHLTTVVPFVFCGAFYPNAMLNLTRLGTDMRLSLTSGALSDLDLLGNFADNHDMQRLASRCQGDKSRIANALAWVMFYRGVPIIYYGTEAYINQTREPMWQRGFNRTAPGYMLIAAMNRVRREQQLGLKSAEVKNASHSTLVFTRGGDLDTWIFVNNLAEASDPVQYCPAPPAAARGQVWADALSGHEADIRGGCYHASSSAPRALRLVQAVVS